MSDSQTRPMRAIIVGGGFAGRAAARQLADGRYGGEIVLFDKNPYTTMLPALPDLAGARLAGEYLIAGLDALLPPGVRFINDAVRALDLDRRVVQTSHESWAYDHLVIAAGSVTNFYGFDQHRESLYKLDGYDDALGISERFPVWAAAGGQRVALVVGGGYTGLELAANLRWLADRCGRAVRIIVIEKGPAILAFLPARLRAVAQSFLDRARIEVVTETGIGQFDGRNVVLENGQEYADVFLAWCAGSTMALADLHGRVERTGDGRIMVEPTLQLPGYPGVFAAGDSAAMRSAGQVLRKAVNFAIYSGTHAARNVLASVDARPGSAFRPVDLGWLVPLGDIAVGRLFNRISVSGRSALRLHYLLCGYRNFNWRNSGYFYRHALQSGRRGKSHNGGICP